MRNYTTFTSFFIVAVLLLWSSLVWAQDDDGETADSHEATVNVSGFAVTSVAFPISVPDVEGVPESGDGDEVVFGLSEIEIDIEAEPVAGLTVRADFNYFPSAGSGGDDGIVEQAFAHADFASGLFLSAGKMNAPIGIEGQDATDLNQVSRSQVSAFTPDNLNGFFGGWGNDSMSATLFLTNDWDSPAAANSASLGGRFAYSMDSGHVGLSSTFGTVTAEEPNILIDVDSAWSFGDIGIGFEGLFDVQGDNTVMGGLLALNYALSDSMSITARADYLDMEMTLSFTDPISGETTDITAAASNMSAAGAFNFELCDHLSSSIEVGANMPDEGDMSMGALMNVVGYF
jgi:hypothetical protein